RRMRDHAVRRGALGGGHLPLIGRGLHEHDAGGRAALAHVLVRLADAAAAAGGEVTPGALALNALAGRRVFDFDFRPVALELLGDELREAGDRALYHFGANDADVDAVVGADGDPDADLGRAVLRARDARAAERQAKSERETTGDGGGRD